MTYMAAFAAKNVGYFWIDVKTSLLFKVEVIPDNWTQKFEPPGGQISKP